MKLAGVVEYDGSDFSGWAAQPSRRTVEDTLSQALSTVLRQPVKLAVAGRTDAGVHATGQVVSFSADIPLDPGEIAYKATAVMPGDLALRRCVEAPADFDARRWASSRSYEYRVLNAAVRSPLAWGRSVYISRRLDETTLTEAAGKILGEHNFRAFTPSRTYHSYFVRRVSESRWDREGEELVYRITANSFLYGMVRALIGTMLEVADGKRSPEDFGRLLDSPEARRSSAGPSAPAHGLTLTGVGYEDVPGL
ncbi:tRNA pseudouridine(38-40) synthase TruA [Rubrobacter aplysinae]|uniref:tRNA pseudouridine(38-40) synthase TruA n=1 Tax=Rubrobacter aplysinae TaxID=909625 RepID=UPI00064BD9B5|nr:tRNA pseudouridine(38-40) synthase TruA [Rubrobacter aplysinae]